LHRLCRHRFRDGLLTPRIDTEATCCTAFAVTGSATADGQTLAGQNQDLEAEYADVAILLRVKPTDGRPRALMFTFAGQLGYTGMNEYGIAHFANALYDCPWQPGLPHYPLKRLMLEQRTIAACIDLLQRHRTCSAANVVLCDGQGQIADVEVRPEGIARFTDLHPDRIVHANHYLTDAFAPHETNSLADSCPRLDRMRTLLQAHWGRLDVETIKTLLADHEGEPAAICRHGAVNMHSISGYIAEPAKRLFHVRRGHGCLGTWTAYEV
jgi:isopenicillin-N N-acyltransferase-like protein